MYHEFERGEFTIVVADHPHPTWEFIQQAAVVEKNKEYSDIAFGTKYEYNCVICYQQMPVTSFFMMNGGRYPSNCLRVFTKLYSTPHVRQQVGLFSPAVTMQSISILSNFIEDILPQTEIPPYDFYFWSKLPGEQDWIRTLNRKAVAPWSLSENLYFTGTKETDARAWRYIAYKGDIDRFNQPSMSPNEYQLLFGKQLNEAQVG